MKRTLLLLSCVLLLCAAGCNAGPTVSEAPTPGLPVVEVAPKDLGAKLAELSEGAQGESDLFGYPIRPGWLADLNGDGAYELYANLCFGSGIVDERVQYCDPASGHTSVLSDRMITDYYATEYEGALYIIARPYEGGESVAYRAALINGELACEEIDSELQEAVLEANAD